MRYQEAFDIYRTYTGLAQSELNYRHVQLTEAHKKIQEAVEKAEKYDVLIEEMKQLKQALKWED